MDTEKPKQNENATESSFLKLRQKIEYLIGIMTIEPMMFLQGLAGGISMNATNQMILYKTCREFNATAEYCHNIENHTDDALYDDIEKEVVSFNNVIALTEHFVPILLSFYIGSWSDKFGRKPFLALCMAGKICGAISNFLAAVFLDGLNRWTWLAIYMPVQNISGGQLTFVMMTYSFITDNSMPRDRMLRLGILGFMWDISYFVSLPLGAWLFNSGSYVCVLGTSLVLYILASLTMLIRLWGFPEKINQANMSFKELVSYRNVTDSFKATFKKRPGNKHLVQQAMMLVMLLYMMAGTGEMYIQFMYTKRMFQWQMDRYSYFGMIETLICNLGTMTSLPIFHHFNVNDNIIILTSSISGIASRLIKALAKTETTFFLAPLGGIFLNVFYAPIRAQMTRCVTNEDLGKVFAMLASFESAVPITASAIFTTYYNATSELDYPWTGSFYLLGIGFFIIGAALTIVVYISLGFKQVQSIDDGENKDHENKDSVPESYEMNSTYL